MKMANEKRLIDANALITQFDGFGFGGECDGEIVLDAIANAPTVDAVEVVRCKDCKQWNCVKKPKGYDKLLGYCLNDDEPIERWEYDFCSYGERKE
jgi:hypothetical protein